MTFVDTSALYALLDKRDLRHHDAQAMFPALLLSNEPLFTTNYVVLETCALLQRRLGLEPVEDLIQKVLPVIAIRWMSAESHNLALATLFAARRRPLSLVDCSSFVAMREAGCSTAFAFDQHFEEAGFQVLRYGT